MMPQKRKKKSKNEYFTKDTEKAILEYLTIEDQELKNKIYKEKIEYAFFKLTQNIIHTYKYYYTDGESIEDLQQEVIFFLLKQLHKFKPEKGAAFSYFGTITKRYLINNNKKNYQKLQDKGDVEEADNDHIIYSDLLTQSKEIDINEFLNLYVKYLDRNFDKLFFKENDRKIVGAVLELFKKRESLEIFNKKALYIYIREITDVDTSQITKIIKKLKQIYAQLYNKYYAEGYIDL